VVDLGSPFYAQMVRGIEETCRNSGRGFLVASGFADRDDEARAVIGLTDRSCDGLILYLENPMRDDVQKILARTRTPAVLVGGEAIKPWAHVGLDNHGGAYAGMRLLLSKGHRKIAYLSGGLNYRDTHVRLRGIGDALAEAGMGPKDIHIEHGRFEESFGYEATERLLHLGPAVTAIFSGDDDIAAGALLAIKRFGLRVPEDISLLGFDDNFHARHLTPALTTVRQPIDEAGRAATRLLLDILDGKAPAQTDITIPTELILRESVGPAPPGA
jgi:LacI family transcriptional regulator